MTATPFTYTKQEWFDAAWERAKDLRKSYDEERHQCTYQPQGDIPPCLVGARLTPEQLAYFAERGLRSGAGKLVNGGVLGVAEATCKAQAEAFLVYLQRVHDSFPPESWEGELRAFALYWGCTVPEGGA